ncbi:retron system putative HNH endonuclease [Flavobacterium ajazii]|uniref:retron system putative HNH endonuclease n=1 Tax=Flavobacterium ajazii TaxID=2692318 RepID=UPI0013CF6FF4|nr:retron system putative HNH endonuclease [Flavobacterium ajazii]
MKHIIKQEEPQAFTNWKVGRGGNAEKTYKGLNRNHNIKDNLRDSLLQEQGYICCYCEKELKSNDRHIEHFKPKHKFPQLQLEYENLFCSCQVNLINGEPLHCGNSKGNFFDERFLISPLEPNCESRFKYTFDGQIFPADENDIGAKITIIELNLDELENLRKGAIEPFLNLDDEMSEEELSLFISSYLKDKADNEGKFNEFYTTIKYLFLK